MSLTYLHIRVKCFNYIILLEQFVGLVDLNHYVALTSCTLKKWWNWIYRHSRALYYTLGRFFLFINFGIDYNKFYTSHSHPTPKQIYEVFSSQVGRCLSLLHPDQRKGIKNSRAVRINLTSGPTGRFVNPGGVGTKLTMHKPEKSESYLPSWPENQNTALRGTTRGVH